MKTRKLVIGVCLLSLLLAGAVLAQDPFAAWDALYAKRDGTDAIPKQILAAAEQQYAQAPSYDAAWRAARSCFWICDRSENKAVDVEYGKKGWDWGLKAIQLSPNRVEGHMYGVACLGEYSKGISIAKAVTQGLASKFKEMGNKAVALDPGFDHAAPLKAMGQYYHKLPKLLRDLKKAEEFYLRAQQAIPCDVRTRAYLVELYMDWEKWDKARATADAASAMTGCADLAWETAWYKEQIKKMAAKIPAQ
jgi:hypothetical protein